MCTRPEFQQFSFSGAQIGGLGKHRKQEKITGMNCTEKTSPTASMVLYYPAGSSDVTWMVILEHSKAQALLDGVQAFPGCLCFLLLSHGRSFLLILGFFFFSKKAWSLFTMH